MGAAHCTGCKNQCPLSSPKCEVGAALSAAEALPQSCKMCPKRCPLNALECSLGQTMFEIKSKNLHSDDSI